MSDKLILESELVALSALSEKIGRDPMLVQGAGGNTSIKTNGVLWVKASGKWLASACREAVFVPLRLQGIRDRIAAGEIDPVMPEVLPNALALRPSIETSLHALLPHRVVLHVHSINALFWAVQQDGQSRVAALLDGLAWAWVPYRRPGLPLTEYVATLLLEKRPDVLVLANHGLVVGGEDLDAAQAILSEVESRLATPVRIPPPADPVALSRIAAGTPFVPAADLLTNGLGTDPNSLAMVTAGSLYPDHVVFLDGPPLVWSGVDAAALEHAKLVLIPGVGTLQRADLTASAASMVQCLALLAARLEPGLRLSYLDSSQEKELRSWDAEKHRQALNR